MPATLKQEPVAFMTGTNLMAGSEGHVEARAVGQVAGAETFHGGCNGVYSPAVWDIISDKCMQKLWLKGKGFPVIDFLPLEPRSRSCDWEHAKLLSDEDLLIESLRKSVHDACIKFGRPLMLKARRSCSGEIRESTYLVSSPAPEPVVEGLKMIGSASRAVFVERFCPFVAEVVVFVVRSANTGRETYPAFERIKRDGKKYVTRFPFTRGGPDAGERAEALAEEIVSALGDGAIGTLGVKMFLLADGNLVVNGISPGPGEGGYLLRSILSFTPGPASPKLPYTAVLHILSSTFGEDGLEGARNLAMKSLEVPRASLHWYVKAECAKGDKIGQITIVGDSEDEVDRGLQAILGEAAARCRAGSIPPAKSYNLEASTFASPSLPTSPPSTVSRSSVATKTTPIPTYHPFRMFRKTQCGKKELSMLRKVSHPNIVEFLGVEGDTALLEHAIRGDCFFMFIYGKVEWKHKKKWCLQVWDALNYF